MMDLFAAIDLRDGRCVRLHQGDFAQETVYGDDPIAVAKELAAGGAAWIHVVDLDAARTGSPTNRGIVAEIARAIDVPVQAGGGVRSAADAAAMFDAGVTRVVVGTAAMERPELVAELSVRHPGGVAVGLDARGNEVALHGWTKGSGRSVAEAIACFDGSGVAAFVITEISRDGTMRGPDLAGLRTALRATEVPVVASGGVGTLEDLRALVALDVGDRRLVGAIVGKAIYEAAFTIEEAVTACKA
ncbi:MAG TPA: 1-(5-phosphoribosyl)-5-[(5-phosphoribosylamino)methylideneamino]imidazole-4-carboxamide isomerase [Acidimicrobiales bacterium]|nr:1-(5-phosphoribosyl)-5-[(5-phosphoribosylamino)methylideneamino]imidazole-4-carboxamide isomerase [Acidimicrobiales bacterium]